MDKNKSVNTDSIVDTSKEPPKEELDNQKQAGFLFEQFENIETLIGTLEDNFGECNLVANQLGRGILRDDIILLGSMFPPHPVNMSDFVVSMNGSEIALGLKS